MTAPRNRVRGIAELPAARVEPSPGNWRTHDAAQRAKMAGLLGEIGSVSELVVWVPDDAAREALRRLPGPEGFAAWLAGFSGKVRLLDGHMRRGLRGKKLGVQITDLDAREAALVLATFDPIGAQAGRDDALLRELLDGQRSDHRGLEDLLADLRASVGAPVAAGPDLDEGPAVDPTDEILAKWAALGCVVGSLWEIPSADGQRVHRVLCGDARNPLVRRRLGQPTAPALIYDPPWDAGIMLERAATDGHETILAFGDGGRVGDIVRLFGAPTWLFAWDCVTSWYTPRRPLRRMKLCAFYGDLGAYEPDAAHYGKPGEVKEVTNTRGTYRYEPDPRGKHLSDVFQRAITAEHEPGTHRHEKPLDWMRLLIGNCTRGDVVDPFGGRGTSLVAAEQLGRRADIIETEPRHVAATLERLTLAGLVPRRVG